MLVKVCGMKEPDNIRLIAGLQPDMMGFIFYPGSDRYVGGLEPEVMAALPENIKRVGVFVNEPPGQIWNIVSRYRISMIQLHGDEPPEVCEAFRGEGFKVMKAFRIGGGTDFQQTALYEGKCHFFLFDTRGDSFGGTGKTFNWEDLKYYRGKTPFLLSGGISPEHIQGLKTLRHPQFAGIDLNSRFEITPGIKDPALVAVFLQALKADLII